MRLNNNKKKTFVIEHCENCHLHRWNTRHDEKKYSDMFKVISDAIVTKVKAAMVMKN